MAIPTTEAECLDLLRRMVKAGITYEHMNPFDPSVPGEKSCYLCHFAIEKQGHASDCPWPQIVMKVEEADAEAEAENAATVTSEAHVAASADYYYAEVDSEGDAWEAENDPENGGK